MAIFCLTYFADSLFNQKVRLSLKILKYLAEHAALLGEVKIAGKNQKQSVCLRTSSKMENSNSNLLEVFV